MIKSKSPPAKMSDIARLAGVHASTVSRALAGSSLVEKSVRERIVQLAREHGYVVNTTARNLRLKRTRTLSVVIPLAHEKSQTLSDPFFSKIIGHLADEITQRDYGMFLQKVLLPMDNWLPRLVVSQRTDGIIVVGQGTEHEVLEQVAKHHGPLVVWGGHLAEQSYCTIGTDNVGGARLAVDHLIRQGRKHILFVGDTEVPEISLRHKGYLLALQQAGMPVSSDRVLAAHVTPDAAYEAVRAYAHAGERFDALFAATDVIAISAMRALAAAGLNVPRDVAVVGFDDIDMAAHVTPTLTTVRQDLEHGAKLLVDAVLRRLEGENAPSATMPGELVVRESSVVTPMAG